MSSEQIYIEQDRAHASWLMLQTSTFRDGRSHLNAAKLTVHFQQQVEGMWKIKHFQTENILAVQSLIGIAVKSCQYRTRTNS